MLLYSLVPIHSYWQPIYLFASPALLLIICLPYMYVFNVWVAGNKMFLLYSVIIICIRKRSTEIWATRKQKILPYICLRLCFRHTDLFSLIRAGISPLSDLMHKLGWMCELLYIVEFVVKCLLWTEECRHSRMRYKKTGMYVYRLVAPYST